LNFFDIRTDQLPLYVGQSNAGTAFVDQRSLLIVGVSTQKRTAASIDNSSGQSKRRKRSTGTPQYGQKELEFASFFEQKWSELKPDMSQWEYVARKLRERMTESTDLEREMWSNKDLRVYEWYKSGNMRSVVSVHNILLYHVAESSSFCEHLLGKRAASSSRAGSVNRCESSGIGRRVGNIDRRS
jgi:hypothetical protein